MRRRAEPLRRQTGTESGLIGTRPLVAPRTDAERRGCALRLPSTPEARNHTNTTTTAAATMSKICGVRPFITHHRSGRARRLSFGLWSDPLARSSTVREANAAGLTDYRFGLLPAFIIATHVSHVKVFAPTW